MTSTRTNYDAAFCGKLPLNQTNMIQPHGVLLILSKIEFIILQVSENVEVLMNLAASDVVEKPVATFLEPESYQRLQQKCSGALNGKLPVTLCFRNQKQNKNCLAVLQEMGDCYMVEIELIEFVSPSDNSFVTVFQKVKQVMSAVNAAKTVTEVCTVAVKELKDLSGFDKVMLYTFDDEWNGSVMAEEKEDGMESYLGLKFPASDIPKPARDMYLKNPYRIIPNRLYQPVRLYPVLNPLTHTFTNLGGSDLRSVAAVHLEYLKNMKVMASMSTRIVYNEKLWGLISCHHRTAKYLSFEECSVFELLSDVISSKISSLLNNQSFQIKDKLNESFTQMVENSYKENNLISVFYNNQQLVLKLLSADGVALFWDQQIETAGKTPKKTDIEMIGFWLQGKQINKTYVQTALPHLMEEAGSFASVASGLLALPIQAEKGIYLLAFRPEVIKKVSWGGNPNEAITFEKNSSVYHPRNSFNLWQEVVRQTSTPWLPEEVAAAEMFRNYLVEFVLNQLNK